MFFILLGLHHKERSLPLQYSLITAKSELEIWVGLLKREMPHQ